jgi:hypothetical protein
VTATNITCHKTLHGAYVKTWTGQQVGYPPNGGGGGLGCELSLPNLAPTNPHPRHEKHSPLRLQAQQPSRNTLQHFSMHNVQRGSRSLQHFTV